MSHAPGRTGAAVLVLAAGLTLLWWTRGSGDDPAHDVADDVRACKANLQEIYRGLRDYRDRFGHAPEGSGVAFFGALIADGVWENRHAEVQRLTCPGPGAQAVPPGTSFADLAALTAASSAYAGRDIQNHALPKFPAGGSEIQTLAACDNANGMNHARAMNVLLSDGTVKTYVLAQLVEQGRLPAEATTIPVGPDSPLEDLWVLVAD